MVTTYTSGTPVPTNAPSQDVVNMQNNSIAINEWVGFDHTGFNLGTNTGLHKQVTFNANESAPGIGSGVADLYVNSATGILGTMSSLFFQNATKNLPLFNLPLTTSGTNYSITSPWGLIFNFGFNAGSSSTTTVTYASAFTSSPALAILISPSSTDPSRLVSVNTSGSSTMQFQAKIQTTSTGFFYLAIGS